MAKQALTKDFWNNRYLANETGWDIGFPSPALTEYTNQLPWRDKLVLIPGCGNAHEAAYMLKQGFTHISIIDIAPSLTAALEHKYKKDVGKNIQIINGDFFEHEGKYDLIIEETFFCALNPSLRPAYSGKMHTLLVKGGHLAGVLFNGVFEAEGPPFGGTLEEYQLLFEKQFEIKTLKLCYNSIEQRMDTELFFNLVPK